MIIGVHENIYFFCVFLGKPWKMLMTKNHFRLFIHISVNKKNSPKYLNSSAKKKPLTIYLKKIFI